MLISCHNSCDNYIEIRSLDKVIFTILTRFLAVQYWLVLNKIEIQKMNYLKKLVFNSLNKIFKINLIFEYLRIQFK
jgi:hypothetical protein